MTLKRFAAVALCLAMVFCTVFAEETELKTQLSVHFLNMGRNDAILIECNGEAAFIDGGGHGRGEKIVTYLKEQGVESLKYYIGTHGHVDHVGCTGYILNEIPAECILTNYSLAIEAMLSDCKYRAEKDAVNGTEVKYVERGDVFYIGEAILECIGPDKITRWASYKDGNENSNSLLLRLTFGNHSFVLTGDTTNDVLQRMLKEEPGLFDCTVFKSPHHDVGLADDSAKLISCEYFIFSTASDDIPKQNRINCARKMGARVFITSYNNAGTTVFTTDGETMTHTTEYAITKMKASVSSSITMTAGNRKSTTVSIHPTRMVDTLHATSTDESVAYYDPNTKYIYAVGPGECTIRIIAFDDTCAEIQVKVKEKKK